MIKRISHDFWLDITFIQFAKARGLKSRSEKKYDVNHIKTQTKGDPINMIMYTYM